MAWSLLVQQLTPMGRGRLTTFTLVLRSRYLVQMKYEQVHFRCSITSHIDLSSWILWCFPFVVYYNIISVQGHRYVHWRHQSLSYLCLCLNASTCKLVYVCGSLHTCRTLTWAWDITAWSSVGRRELFRPTSLLALSSRRRAAVVVPACRGVEAARAACLLYTSDAADE